MSFGADAGSLCSSAPGAGQLRSDNLVGTAAHQPAHTYSTVGALAHRRCTSGALAQKAYRPRGNAKLDVVGRPRKMSGPDDNSATME